MFKAMLSIFSSKKESEAGYGTLVQAEESLEKQQAELLAEQIRSRARELFGLEDVTKIKNLSERRVDRLLDKLDPTRSLVDNRLAYDILEERAKRDLKYTGIFNLTIANPDRLVVGGDMMDVYRGIDSPHRNEFGRPTYFV